MRLRLCVLPVFVGLSALSCARAGSTPAPVEPAGTAQADTSRSVASAPAAANRGADGEPTNERRGKLIPINDDAYGGIAWAANNAPKLGDIAPSFELRTADGGTFRSDVALADGPLVIVFYRGYW